MSSAGVGAIEGVFDEDEAIPRISAMADADFEDIFLEAIARARCLKIQINKSERKCKLQSLRSMPW